MSQVTTLQRIMEMISSDTRLKDTLVECLANGHNGTDGNPVHGSVRVKSTKNFDKTWCVCSTYGAHHPYQHLTTYITWFLIFMSTNILNI